MNNPVYTAVRQQDNIVKKEIPWRYDKGLQNYEGDGNQG